MFLTIGGTSFGNEAYMKVFQIFITNPLFIPCCQALELAVRQGHGFQETSREPHALDLLNFSQVLRDPLSSIFSQT
jgi:hypothetical protein